MVKKIVLIVVSAIALAIASYMVIPKYDVYVDGGTGTIIYRFNKITGHRLEVLQDNGDWGDAIITNLDNGIRHPATWKEK